jgi:hypothetical protein
MEIEKFGLPQTSLPRTEKIIRAYYLINCFSRRDLTSKELSDETRRRHDYISQQDISGNISLLRDIGVLEPSYRKDAYNLSEFGMEFGEIISQDGPLQLRKYWKKSANRSKFILSISNFIKTSQTVPLEVLKDKIFTDTDTISRKDKYNVSRGATTIIQILTTAKIIIKRNLDKATFYDFNKEEVTPQFITDEKIQNLINFSSQSNYDLTKLIKLCESVNFNYEYEYGYYYAVGMLIRAILDHVPPIFGQDNFDGIVNNYPGRSFKGQTKTLSEYRDTFDGYLHNHISFKENLANETQVDCASILDSFLGELIKLLVSQKKKMYINRT